MKGWLLCSLFALCCVPHEILCAAKPSPELTRFLNAKRAYIERVATELAARLPPDVNRLFDTASEGNWHSVSNLFESMDKKHGPNVKDSPIPREVWYVLQEVGGSYEVLGFWNPKFTRQFAAEILKVVPTDAIYFGGTDPGRFIITAFSESHEEGKPFFTLTQNQLVASGYLAYLRRIYGHKVKLPTAENFTDAFNDYLKDAQSRLEHDSKFPDEPKQLKPGEYVKIIDDRVHVSGQTAVMAINARLVRNIFDNNADRAFYVEESFGLDWTYPHLTPEGPIFKLNRKKIARFSPELVAKDRAYWDTRVENAIGQRITDETSIAEVCAFADQVFRRHKLDDFKGDRAYLKEPDATNHGQTAQCHWWALRVARCPGW